jgi:hypothetical protein
MNIKRLFYLFALFCSMFVAGCGNDVKPPVIALPLPKKPVVMEPFRFHKLIEVSPGQDYDILSWGRGSSTVGSFMILHSDSAAAKYTTTTGDLDGAIVDVYNSDMDMDGNPEILVQAKGRDTINYTNIYAFEFTNGKAQKLDFPKLTKSQRQGYRGDDNFYIKDGKFMREFPIFDGNGKDAKPTGQKRQLEYGLRNNSFTVKQLSKDSTAVGAVKQVNAPVKSTKPEKSGSSTKKTKKHTTEKKSKKKHKKHHNDEG